VFKSQTFELSNSTLKDFLKDQPPIPEEKESPAIQRGRLNTIPELKDDVSNIMTERPPRYEKLPEEQFMAVSACFDEKFKNACAEVSINEGVDDNFIDA
jgi:hypothetical protein